MTNKLYFFNTLTRKKELFTPYQSDQVTMYTCGPTVYNYAHIGNFRTYVFEDLLRRTLKYFGYSVKQVMNITDIDDKTIKGAIEKKISLDAYTKVYKEAFFKDLATLHIEKVENYPEATAYIPEMIRMIETLIDKNIAYKGQDGSIYFAINKFPNYGCLSHLNLEDLKVGASTRVATDEYDKENASDFVLWKGYDEARDGGIYWESPFGKGRPGWHLECSVMAMEILGDQLDIHVGGVDNIFPHHENEIAQSEACSGKKFSKFWLHAEHLVVDNRKMSKSLGNFYTLRDLTDKGFTGTQVRYLLLQTHYRTQSNFTLEGLSQAKQSLQRIKDFIVRLSSISLKDSKEGLHSILKDTDKKFHGALADDLNISLALAALFDLIREVHSLCDKEMVSQQGAKEVLSLLKKMDKVLGVLFVDEEEVVPDKVIECLEKRNQARKEKNWQLADEMRDLIDSMGFVIEDSASGSRAKKK